MPKQPHFRGFGSSQNSHILEDLVQAKKSHNLEDLVQAKTVTTLIRNFTEFKAG